MSVSVRLAEEADIPVLEELFSELSDPFMRRDEAIRKAIEDPDGELLVAESDGEVVAYIHQIFFHDPFHAGLNSIITSLFVKREHRRKRIASQLIETSVKDAKRRNVIEVHVDTEERNEKAIRLYERHGFKRSGILFERTIRS